MDQIGPTKDLLVNLDKKHPDILRAEGVEPADYHGSMVFRSAIESIRGTFAATTTPRAQFTNAILARMKDASLLKDWQSIGGRGRCDYNLLLPKGRDDWHIAVESKGGEGNSFNIGERPNWSDEYIIWGHLDGSIVNQPDYGASANLFTRLSAEIVAEGKLVDAYIVLDRFCGTSIRPCPKMPKDAVGQVPPPCIFLLPRSVPTVQKPDPGLAKMDDVRLVNALLSLFRVSASERDIHVKRVRIEIYRKDTGTYKSVPMRRVSVFQGAKMVEQKEMRITRGEHIFRDTPMLRDGPIA